MTSSTIQGELWGAAARDWAELFEPMSKPLWVSMIDSADVGQGTKFLDLGCGGGGASLLAAERGAQVAGLDAAAPLIEIARERLPNGRFRVGDLEELPYDDNRFDVTFASMSLMFAANLPVALQEMKRVTVSGGRVTVGIWGKPEDCEYRHVLQAIADTLPSPPSGKGPFSLSEPGKLEGMMQACGLEVSESGEVDAPFQFADFALMWRIVSSAGPIQSARRKVSEQLLQTAIKQAAKPFKTGKGDILMNNRFRYVTATAASGKLLRGET